jgi:hypothetical protein
MPVVMCTQQLWKRVGDGNKLLALSEVDDRGDGRLGNWSAKPITVFRRPHVLLANEATLMCVLVRLAPARTVFDRFAELVGRLLVSFGVDSDTAEIETTALREHLSFARNANRSLLGSLNDLAYMARAWAADFVHEADGGEYEGFHDRLNDTPHVKRDPSFAVDAVRAHFGLPRLTHASRRYVL